MYKIALQTLKANFAFYGLFVGLLVVLERLFPINAGVSFVMGAMLALYTHRMILLGENYSIGDLFKSQGPSGEKPPLLMFYLVSGIGVVIFLVLLAASFFLLFGQFRAFAQEGEMDLFTAILMAAIPASAVYGIILSAVGTVFPATAIGGDKSLKAAWQLGRPSLWKTYMRLAIGPFAFSIVGTSLVIGLAGFFAEAGVGVGNISIEILLAMLAYCVNFGSILLGVTALSMAYQGLDAAK